jgi:hypothetical protein
MCMMHMHMYSIGTLLLFAKFRDFQQQSEMNYVLVFIKHGIITAKLAWLHIIKEVHVTLPNETYFGSSAQTVGFTLYSLSTRNGGPVGIRLVQSAYYGCLPTRCLESGMLSSLRSVSKHSPKDGPLDLLHTFLAHE